MYKIILKTEDEGFKEICDEAFRFIPMFASLIASSGINLASATLAMLMLSAFESKRSGCITRDEFMETCEQFWDGVKDERTIN